MATAANAANPARARPCPKGRCSEHRIAIDSPVEAVWDELMDFAGWSTWNPLYAQTAGTLAVGNRITMVVTLAGSKPHNQSATVMAIEPPALIEYEIDRMGGLLRVLRYIELTATGPASCRIANGEIMGGPAGKLLARFIGPRVREGIKGMNRALKARVEGRRQATQ